MRAYTTKLRRVIPNRALYTKYPLSGNFNRVQPRLLGNAPRPTPLRRTPHTRGRLFSCSRSNRFLYGDSTIYALSTASGRAAIAVIRVSGPACKQVYKALCPKALPLPKPRLASVRTLYDPTREPSSNSVLDSGALVLYFPGPRTVTGEDVLEFQVHGGPAIVKSVLVAIANVKTDESGGDGGTVRYAEPGEFTRRAFMNNRVDLPQIEALGDTLAADTEQQRRLAVRGASDKLSKRYELWRHQLLYARGELEALIDFSEDQHFDESTEELVSSVAGQVRELRAQIGFHIQNASRGELLRNGIKIALLGAPNAGKSSLLNRVVGKEAAIVSTEEGTTRDIVDVGVDIGGWYCKLGDMAGIRAGDKDKGIIIGAVEKEGIRRARARALESDVVVAVVSLELEEGRSEPRLFVEPEVVDAVNDCVQAGKCIIVAVNKSDRLPDSHRNQLPPDLSATINTLFPAVPATRIFSISCHEASQGLDLSTADPGNIQTFLRGLITTFEEIASPLRLEDETGKYDISYWEDSLGVTHRQSSNLQRCLQHLEDFLYQTQPKQNPKTDTKAQMETRMQTQTPETQTPTPDYAHDHALYEDIEDVDIVTAAEHLRFAADALAKITGKGESGDVEDVLGIVFEKFCVGK